MKKLKRFKDFSINESDEKDIFLETPEEYINDKLVDVKSKIDNLFNDSTDELSFNRLGLKLEYSEISRYSKLYDSLQVKFSDKEYQYSLYIMIQLENALKGTIVSDDIDECYIKFKKYDIKTTDLIGKISINEKIKNINKDLIIKLKSDLDKKLGNDDNELKIEFE